MPESCCHALPKAPEQGPLYLKKALLNILFAVPLIILNALLLIPSPLSLAGCFIGLGLAVITLLVMKYSGGEYYKSAYEAFKKKKTNMHSLVALSTIIAWTYSVVLCIFPHFFPVIALHYHFAEVGMILGVVNLGRWRRAKAEDEIHKKTQSYVHMLSKYQPVNATRCILENGKENKIIIKADNIELNDILEIKPGERFPVEGVIVSISGDNLSWVDQKNITGESEAVKKALGDSVLTGTLNKTHTLKIKATVKGVDNNLKKLLNAIQMRQKAVDSKLIDKITRYFIPIILSVALMTAVSWIAFAPIALSILPLMIQSVMSVLLCACPCALGLAIPVATSVTIHSLSEKGILVKNANSFEKAHRINTIIFDKTGTLTEPVIETRYFPEAEFSENEFLNYAASLEKCHNKSHPIAKAIQQSASHFYEVTQAITDSQGMKGNIQDKQIMVGSLDFCLKEGARLDSHYIQKAQDLNNRGQTSVFIIQNLRCVGVVGLKHRLSVDAKNQIDKLKARGMTLGLLTGDKRGPASAIAQELGLDPNWVWSECSAEQKQDKIIALKKAGRGVAMIGDGMNDILACKEADVSFAIHAWTNAAVKCDVALQGSIEGIGQFLDSSKVAMGIIKQNLAWTFGYNLIALMGATGLLFPILSCALNPILATALMACSSIVVILNAQRLPRLLNEVFSRKMNPPQKPAAIITTELEVRSKLRSKIECLPMSTIDCLSTSTCCNGSSHMPTYRGLTAVSSNKFKMLMKS